MRYVFSYSSNHDLVSEIGVRPYIITKKHAVLLENSKKPKQHMNQHKRFTKSGYFVKKNFFQMFRMFYFKYTVCAVF